MKVKITGDMDDIENLDEIIKLLGSKVSIEADLGDVEPPIEEEKTIIVRVGSIYCLEGLPVLLDDIIEDPQNHEEAMAFFVDDLGSVKMIPTNKLGYYGLEEITDEETIERFFSVLDEFTNGEE